MRSRTLANEKTRPFYARLKRPHIVGWYQSKLDYTTDRRKRLPGKYRSGTLRIDQLAFFRKHFWYHFEKASIEGWIPVKHFRKNYCQLSFSKKISNITQDGRLVCVIQLCEYVKANADVKQIVRQYRQIKPRSVDDFFTIIAGQLGRFKNVSHKSMRMIRSQIWHQKPVVMKVMLSRQKRYILLVGFNRRVFIYRDPQHDHLRFISRKRLIKAWQRCHYQAFSC